MVLNFQMVEHPGVYNSLLNTASQSSGDLIPGKAHIPFYPFRSTLLESKNQNFTPHGFKHIKTALSKQEASVSVFLVFTVIYHTNNIFQSITKTKLSRN